MIEFIVDQYIHEWVYPEFNDAMYWHFNKYMPDRRCNIEEHLLRVRLWRNL